MAAQDGALLLLAIGNGGGPETFAIIGGVSVTKLALTNKPPESTTLISGQGRALLSAAGPQSAEVTLSGNFTNSAAEEALRACAFAVSSHDYQLTFPNGDTLTGAFVVTAYARDGEYGSAEKFSVTLASSGALSYVHV